MKQYMECITPDESVDTILPASAKYSINYWIDISDEEIQCLIDEAKEYGYVCRTTPEEVRSHIYEVLVNTYIKPKGVRL